MNKDIFYLIHSASLLDRSFLSGQKVIDVFDSVNRRPSWHFSISIKPMLNAPAIPSLLIIDPTLDSETLCVLTLQGIIETVENSELSTQVKEAVQKRRSL